MVRIFSGYYNYNCDAQNEIIKMKLRSWVRCSMVVNETTINQRPEDKDGQTNI